MTTLQPIIAQLPAKEFNYVMFTCTSVRERRQRFVIIFKTLEGKPRPTEPTLHTSVDPDSLLKCTVHIHAADDYYCLFTVYRLGQLNKQQI